MKIPYVLIGFGILLLIFLLMLPFFIGSIASQRRTSSDRIGILESTDGGTTWQARSRSSEVSVSVPSSILSFAFDPGNSSIMYLGTKGGGLWISKNGGETWAAVKDAKGTLFANADIYSIAIASLDTKVIYLAVYQDSRGRVLRSTDGGITFDEVYFVPIDRFGVFGVATDPNNARHIYTITGQGGFFESTNGGISWRVRKWFPDGLIRLVENYSNPLEFYVTTPHGEMYRTSDGGGSFVRLTEGYRLFPNANEITDVMLDPTNPSVIYTASKFGLLRSPNAGVLWGALPIIIPPEALPIRTIAINPVNSDEIYVGVSSQIYKTEDGGEHWQILDLPTSAAISMIRINPQNPNIIYVILQ